MLLFSLLQPAEPRLRIDLVFVGPIGPLVEETAMKEATSIWAPYNVDLHSTSADAVPNGELRIAVILARRRDQMLPAATLGAIRFRQGAPEPTIMMYPQTIDAMVSATPYMRAERECLPALHDLMLGRAFGRALAHEIGHYLLRSRGHAPGGLMRAVHRSPELVAPERAGFDLSPSEVEQIFERLTLAHE